MQKTLAKSLTSRAQLALTAARRRAEDAGLADDPETKAALASIYDRLADVLYEGVEPNYARGVVSAACELAEAIAGPQTQRTEVAGAVTLAGLVAASLTVPGLPQPGAGLGACALAAGAGAGAGALPPAAHAVMGSGEVSTPSPALPARAPALRRSSAVAPVVRRAGAKAGEGDGGGGGSDSRGLEGGGGGKNGGGGSLEGEGVISAIPPLADLLA